MLGRIIIFIFSPIKRSMFEICQMHKLEAGEMNVVNGNDVLVVGNFMLFIEVFSELQDHIDFITMF